PALALSARRLQSTTTSLSSTCPSCGRPLPTRLPSCTNCWTIGDVSPSERCHDILSVPSGPNPFRVDTKELRRNFLKAQQTCHPDMWSARGEKERQLAERLSSRVNDAYKTLQEPIPRAQYLLEAQGMGIQEEEPPLEDLEALSEVMETMEEIDTSPDKATLENIKHHNDARMNETIADLEGAFEVPDYSKAKSELIRLIYWDRIDKGIK
ncbi:hypothetical protein M407DRAFT_43812, partial [Tulasnella calospora MUT 4182]